MGKAPKIAMMRFDEAKAGEAEDPTADGDESRVRCPHCGKLMVPRTRYYKGWLSHSICPFCFETYKENTSKEYLDFVKSENVMGNMFAIILIFVFIAIPIIFCIYG